MILVNYKVLYECKLLLLYLFIIVVYYAEVLGVSTSTYEFLRDTIQPIADAVEQGRGLNSSAFLSLRSIK